MKRIIVGQVINIVPDEPFSILTIESASGEIVRIRYDETAHGIHPSMGGIYAIEYTADGGTRIAVNISRPKPGQYLDSYHPPDAPDVQKLSVPQTHEVQTQKPVIVLDDLSLREDSFSSPSYSRPNISTTDPEMDSESIRNVTVYSPEVGDTSATRPEGLYIISSLYFAFSVVFLISPFWFGSFLALLFMLLALGLLAGQWWAYVCTLLIVVLIGCTIIGLPIAIPAWIYLRSENVRNRFYSHSH